MPVKITEENFKQEIEQSTLPVILDMYAPWCGPCRQMEPHIEQLEKEIGNKYKFAKLNVDEARELAIKYAVTSIPTFLFIKNGNVINKETGYMSKDDLKSKIEAIFSK